MTSQGRVSRAERRVALHAVAGARARGPRVGSKGRAQSAAADGRHPAHHGWAPLVTLISRGLSGERNPAVLSSSDCAVSAYAPGCLRKQEMPGFRFATDLACDHLARWDSVLNA